MDEIILEINEFSNELSLALDKLSNDAATLDDLERLDSYVSNIFKSIRLDGVCRQDIHNLNKLGLLELEEKYFSETKSVIGADVALEAEGTVGFMAIVIGGVLSAMVLVLSWFVGKFLGWLLASTDKLKDASSSIESKTKVKVAKDAEELTVDTLKLGGGYSDVVALHNLGPEFLGGDGIKALYDAGTAGLVALTQRIADLSGTDTLQRELDKIVNKRSLLDPLIRTQVAKELKPSTITINLVNDTYPTLMKVMGSKLYSQVAKDRDGDVLPPTSIMAKSQHVTNYKGSEIYADSLTSKTKIDLLIDPSKLTTQVDSKDVDTLTKDVSKLKKYQDKFAKGSTSRGLGDRGFGGATLGAKNTDFIIRAYVNYEITYPAQYLNTLVGKVLSGLMKSHVQYRSLQVKLQSNYGKVFYESELLKLIKLIEDAKLDTKLEADLIKQVADIRGAEITKAAEIFADILSKLEATSTDVKAKLDSINFYKKAKGKLNLRGDKLTSELHEVK